MTIEPIPEASEPYEEAAAPGLTRESCPVPLDHKQLPPPPVAEIVFPEIVIPLPAVNLP